MAQGPGLLRAGSDPDHAAFSLPLRACHEAKRPLPDPDLPANLHARLSLPDQLHPSNLATGFPLLLRTHLQQVLQDLHRENLQPIEKQQGRPHPYALRGAFRHQPGCYFLPAGRQCDFYTSCRRRTGLVEHSNAQYQSTYYASTGDTVLGRSA